MTERGVRRNLFEEFESWHSSSTYGSAGNTAYLQNQLRILNPSLDTYESINGYAQEEKSINLELKVDIKQLQFVLEEHGLQMLEKMM